MSTSSIRTILFDEAPSFETEDATALARIDRFIVRASRKINEDAAGDDYDEAVALLALHNLSLSGLDGTGDEARGPISSEKTDNASVSYAKPESGADDLHSETVWGRKLDSMKKNWFADMWQI